MATMGAAFIVASGVALAETITCDSTPLATAPQRDDITGTASGETIYMMEGNDRVFADGGGDTVYGGSGIDEVTYDQTLDTVKSCEIKHPQ